jgi:hypothetical protein
MGLSLWTSSSPLGEWLVIPGGLGFPPVARAFIPSKKFEDFESEPAIEWRGSVGVTSVRDLAHRSLTILPQSECACEIWADEPTPEPRLFELGTEDGILGYVGEWSSRANVSLSVQRSSDNFPMIYMWGAVRDAAGQDPTDEVGVKLDRRLINGAGLELVRMCFSYTIGPVAQSSTFGEFLDNFQKRALTT